MKPRVLIFLAHYLPGHKAGGPVRSISNLVERLGGEFDFSIVTADRDLGDAGPYPGVEVDRWTDVGPARVLYTSPGRQKLSHFARIIKDTTHEVIYLNSLWNPKFTLLPLLVWRLRLAPCGAIVLAPRGELSTGALRLRATKKRAFLMCFRRFLRPHAILWNASTDLERAEFKAAFGPQTDVFVAPNATPLPASAPARMAGSDEVLRICFVSRICEKKNLAFALDVLSNSKARITFDIYGPQEDAPYWALCERKMWALPPNVEAHYRGILANDQVLPVLAAHDLMIFPTMGENFGHIILESFLAGTPVLLSDTTPWRNLQQAGLGWDLPLGDLQPWTLAVDDFAALPASGREAMRTRVRDHAVKVCGDAAGEEANRELFRTALRRAAHPL